MRREEKYPETKWFKYYNANPKNRITGDCWTRAICTATNVPYNDIVMLGAKIQCETGFEPSYNIDKFANALGLTKHNEPRNYDNTKMTVKEFINKYAEPGKRYMCKVGSHHLIAIVDKKVLDTWDSSNQTMHVYFTKEN